MTTATALRIAREVYPNMRDDDIGDLALMKCCWRCPGYPIFWQTDDPETELRAQLVALREGEEGHA